jgi:hypothetical protein
MWRDLTRICEAEGIPLKLPPAKFPQNGLKAARLALAGESARWTPSFTRAVFAANYAEQKDISEDATLVPILDALGVDAKAAFAAANTPENKDALRRQTEEAASRGLFGAPSFTIGDELFWGNDGARLGTALIQRLVTLRVPLGVRDGAASGHTALTGLPGDTTFDHRRVRSKRSDSLDRNRMSSDSHSRLPLPLVPGVA